MSKFKVGKKWNRQGKMGEYGGGGHNHWESVRWRKIQNEREKERERERRWGLNIRKTPVNLVDTLASLVKIRTFVLWDFISLSLYLSFLFSYCFFVAVFFISRENFGVLISKIIWKIDFKVKDTKQAEPFWKTGPLQSTFLLVWVS